MRPTNAPGHIVETMNRSLKVAEECGEKYAVVTYDFAIGEPAMRTQDAEPESVLHMSGAFHCTLAYFNGMCYILDCLGATDITVGNEILALGSLNVYIIGNHYDRCKRLHIMLANAMSILHYQSFLAAMNLDPRELNTLC